MIGRICFSFSSDIAVALESKKIKFYYILEEKLSFQDIENGRHKFFPSYVNCSGESIFALKTLC